MVSMRELELDSVLAVALDRWMELLRENKMGSVLVVASER